MNAKFLALEHVAEELPMASRYSIHRILFRNKFIAKASRYSARYIYLVMSLLSNVKFYIFPL